MKNNKKIKETKESRKERIRVSKRFSEKVIPNKKKETYKRNKQIELGDYGREIGG